MKLKISDLRKIIKEELEVGKKEYPKMIRDICDLSKGDPLIAQKMGEEWDDALDYFKQHGFSGSDNNIQIVKSRMPSWKGGNLSPMGVVFYLRKNNMNGDSIRDLILDCWASKKQKEKEETTRIEQEKNAPRIKEMTPEERLKRKGPTYGHTDIGVRGAPENMSDDEAEQYLRNKFRGAPMWAFEILRNPETGKLYAYYEIDTSD